MTIVKCYNIIYSILLYTFILRQFPREQYFCALKPSLVGWLFISRSVILNCSVQVFFLAYHWLKILATAITITIFATFFLYRNGHIFSKIRFPDIPMANIKNVQIDLKDRIYKYSIQIQNWIRVFIWSFSEHAIMSVLLMFYNVLLNTDLLMKIFEKCRSWNREFHATFFRKKRKTLNLSPQFNTPNTRWIGIYIFDIFRREIGETTICEYMFILVKKCT